MGDTSVILARQADDLLRRRDLDGMKRLCREHSWLFNKRDVSTWPLLHRCLYAGCADLELVRLFIQYGGDINEKASGGESLLFLMEVGRLIDERDSICELLKEEGAWMSPLEEAFVICGKGLGKEVAMQKIRDLAARTPSIIHERGHQGFTLLHWAVMQQHPLIIEYLLECGANCNALSNNQSSPLGCVPVPYSGEAQAIFDCLTAHGARLSEREDIARLIRIGDEEEVLKRLREKHQLLHAWDSGVSAWLHIAVRWKRPHIAAFLLKEGVDIDAPDWLGNTALHEACQATEPVTEMIELLIQCGANVNAQNERGWTPLHQSIRYPEFVELLVKAGAEVNTKDNKGFTALDWVYKQQYVGRREVARYLKEHGGKTRIVKLKK